jgi:hypothetical protein
MPTCITLSQQACEEAKRKSIHGLQLTPHSTMKVKHGHKQRVHHSITKAMPFSSFCLRSMRIFFPEILPKKIKKGKTRKEPQTLCLSVQGWYGVFVSIVRFHI